MCKTDVNDDWLVIVNPNAGRRKGQKDWNKISSLLRNKDFVFKSLFTREKRHAIELTAKGIEEGYRKIVVVGGDGTMNEVVNGVFKQEICPSTEIFLGMITVGTGNDWGRMFGIPLEYESAIEVLKAFNVYLQDAGVVKYFSGSVRENRYFVNIAGLGFDALVVRRSNKQKEKGRRSKAVYFLTLLRSLLSYSHTKTVVEIDGRQIRNETFTISLGIGKYSGGGMMQTPYAIPDDGLFDITIIKRMRKGEIIRSLKKLYDGTILEHPKIEGYTGKNIKIDSDPVIHLETDGESLGHSPIEFSILPKSVNIIGANLATG
ncbi:MAG TPA: diacylglycerol kinase family protein [Bacteroidales bacterium]|nr:diacylglycerol kinase family protein [Bacteroidales bacterium]